MTIGFSLTIAVLFGGLPGRADAPVEKKEPRRVLRVLLFASSTTREYQFLRSLLLHETDQKHVELTIHIQPPPGRKEQRSGVVQDVPSERLLASFPERLEAYDTIVAFDPDWTRLAPESMAALKKWVEAKGGALVLIAGPINTYRLGRRPDAEKLRSIRDLYPVVLMDSRLVETDINTNKPRRLDFAKGAREWSFLKLDEKGEGPLAGWEEFFTGRKTKDAKPAELQRGFFSYYPVQSVKDGAVVLAALADPEAQLKDGKSQPFLVTMPLGKGRVVYLSSGEMWRLRQSQVAFHKRFWLGLLAYAGGPAGAALKPVEPVKPEQMAASALKLEVDALQALYHFQFTAEQMRWLAGIAPQTARADRRRKPGKVSDELRQLLLDLRNALIDANDEDNIDSLEDKLDELIEKEKPDLDDDVPATAAARRRVPEVLRRMKPAQLAHYLAYIEDEVLDPREHLQTALENVRELKRDEWKEKRDEIAEEIGWLVAGVDGDKSGRVSDRVVELLSKARGLSAEEFKKRRNELDKTAEGIIGDVAPTAVLQHTIEHALLELLSNPQLPAALKTRQP